jgi:hypothetical protein
LTAVLALSACKQEQASDALQENAMAEVPIENAMPMNEVAEIPPVVGPLNATNMAVPPPEFTDTEQMRDDADATGLTARLPDEEAGPGQTGNETRPAE